MIIGFIDSKKEVEGDNLNRPIEFHYFDIWCILIMYVHHSVLYTKISANLTSNSRDGK